MHDEGNLLALGRKADARGARGLHLSFQVCIIAVGDDGYADFLLLSVVPCVDLSVVAVAEGAVGGHRQEADGILAVTGHLLVAAAVDRAFPDVEGTVLLTEVVERLAVGCPDGRAVLTTEGGQFGMLVATEHPDVAADGTLVVLAEGILIAFLVVVEDVALGVDADVFHRDGRP